MTVRTTRRAWYKGTAAETKNTKGGEQSGVADAAALDLPQNAEIVAPVQR